MSNIDLEAERLTLKDVGKLSRVDLSTVWRWCQKGVRGHRLESFNVGGRRYVLRERLDDFVAALNAGRDSPDVGRPSKSSQQRQQRAESELDRIGI